MPRNSSSERPSSTNNASQPAASTTSTCAQIECSLTSQTIATTPADRARARIGVGEEVTLTYSPGSATWQITGNATLSAASGTSVRLTAGATAGSATVTASGSGGSCNMTFTVIAPSSMTMNRASGTNLQHALNRPDCGWKGTVYVHPNDVNFYRVEIREMDSSAVTTGSYNVFTGIKHGNYPAPDYASSWFVLTDHTEANGSSWGNAIQDNIYSGDPGGTEAGTAVPFIAGTMHFPMTWNWRVIGNATSNNFPEFRQEHAIVEAGTCSSAKASHSEQCLYSDATSTP